MVLIISRRISSSFGVELGKKCKPGDILTLHGDLGVGKTLFSKGLGKGLAIDEPISSPTFTVVQVYDSGRLPFIILMYIGSLI